MMAHTGPALPHFMRLGNAILFKGRLDPELREIAILRVGHLLGAAYEVHQHNIVARNIGMDDARVAAVEHGEDDSVFSDLENLVIRFTDEVVASVRASDATWNALSARLDTGQMAELTICGRLLFHGFRVPGEFRGRNRTGRRRRRPDEAAEESRGNPSGIGSQEADSCPSRAATTCPAEAFPDSRNS